MVCAENWPTTLGCRARGSHEFDVASRVYTKSTGILQSRYMAERPVRYDYRYSGHRAGILSLPEEADMKILNEKSKHAGILLTGIVSLLAASVGVASSNPLTNAEGSRIVGVWDVSVTLYNCVTGAQGPTFPALHKYELGGTGQVEPAGSSPANPLHLMVWEYLGKGQYSASIKFFRYDQSGVIGTTVISNVVWLDKDGTQYSGSGIAELFDLDGNKVGVAGCPSLSGTRFTG